VRTWRQWFGPRTSPFIPLPEIAIDPNGGTTIGFLPVWLFTDANQQIRQILAPDLTHNATPGIGGTFRLLSYPSADRQWYVIVGAAEKIVRRFDLSYPPRQPSHSVGRPCGSSVLEFRLVFPLWDRSPSVSSVASARYTDPCSCNCMSTLGCVTR
jgi:hypothetical protein